MAATRRLAIDGDDFLGNGLTQALSPVAETFAEFLWIQQGEDAPEGVVGGNAAWELEKYYS